MFPGRNPGSRSIQGLTIKAEFAKLSAAAQEEQERHRRWAARNWRSKTIQNLAFTIVITIASTVAFSLATAAAPGTMKWAVLALAVSATGGTLVLVTRRYPERQAAHFQLAKRYNALAAACRASINKYEEKLLGDSEFQALLDQHTYDLDSLKRELAD